jgi:hypothetical protein
MMGKAGLIVGLAAGYVLGTRDGRERYEQLKAQATRLVNDPRVKDKAASAQRAVKDKASSSSADDGTAQTSGTLSGPAVPPVTPATTTPTSIPTATPPMGTGTGGVDD